MNETGLTKMEVKAVKRGRAYKKWIRCTWIITAATVIWAFVGIPLVHINSFTNAIYIIGLIILIVAEFYVLILSCWKCPACKEKLPSRSVTGGTAIILMPVLVKKCPHCGADLTQ